MPVIPCSLVFFVSAFSSSHHSQRHSEHSERCESNAASTSQPRHSHTHSAHHTPPEHEVVPLSPRCNRTAAAFGSAGAYLRFRAVAKLGGQSGLAPLTFTRPWSVMQARAGGVRTVIEAPDHCFFPLATLMDGSGIE
jgi:hypothetical protein